MDPTDIIGDDVRLYRGDCLAVMSSLPAESVDLIITSPPYNLGGEPWPHLGHWKPGDGGSGSKSKWRNGSDACGGVQYGEHNDAMLHAEYVEWQQRVLTECWRLLTPTGAIFYNHKPRVIGAKCWIPLELNPGLPLRQIVIWARAGGMNFNPTAYVPTHEWIMVFAKPDFRLKSKGASGVGDVWRVPQESNATHPAPFPLSLPQRILETARGESVLDPFMGSGTTVLAGMQAGVSATGIELDPTHYATALRRLTHATGAGPGQLFAPELGAQHG